MEPQVKIEQIRIKLGYESKRQFAKALHSSMRWVKYITNDQNYSLSFRIKLLFHLIDIFIEEHGPEEFKIELARVEVGDGPSIYNDAMKQVDKTKEQE